MSWLSPVSLPETPAVAVAILSVDEPPRQQTFSLDPVLCGCPLSQWNKFTSHQLHRIVAAASENLTLLETRRKKEQERLMTALQVIASRISPTSPVEDRESMTDYVALTAVKLTASEKKSLGIKDTKNKEGR
jgi:hypothetical protein